MKLKAIFSLSSPLQASDVSPQKPRRLKEKLADLIFCLDHFFIFGDFSHASNTGVFTIFYLIFWGIGQWNNSSSWKHHFKNHLKEIQFALKHIKYKYFLRWWSKNNSFEYVVFHCLIPFSGKEYFLKCTYKNISWSIFLLMVRKNSILNSASFISLDT